ncbi:hypothetical protein GCM10010109_62500 [Actinoplanes campanulatus]|nr:hypothetical protein GCM10010109_62500 [Actinoplanes campanulatus]GID40701.1 hypothetical protein Aca09nite_72070 [Actinoplanes campanulatus]
MHKIFQKARVLTRCNTLEPQNETGRTPEGIRPVQADLRQATPFAFRTWPGRVNRSYSRPKPRRPRVKM